MVQEGDATMLTKAVSLPGPTFLFYANNDPCVVVTGKF
jgi:hypothetical protein